MKNTERLAKKKSSTRLLIDALQILKFSRKNFVRKMVLIIIELIAAFIISCNTKTIELIENSVEIINGIILVLMGIVFTGYAFFQALINDQLLIYLLADSKDEMSKLEESNNYFAHVMMLQFICLLINLFVIIFMLILPKYWVAFNNQGINIALSSILIVFVFHLNVECIWETKSFIFNIFQLINAHAFSRMLDIIEKSDEDDLC